MIELTSNLVNQTNVFQSILPNKEHMSDLMDTVVKKVYFLGRSWIIKQTAKVQPSRVEPKCCLPLSVMPDESPYMYVSVLTMEKILNIENLLMLVKYIRPR
jgi:hypothetical protein